MALLGTLGEQGPGWDGVVWAKVCVGHLRMSSGGGPWAPPRTPQKYQARGAEHPRTGQVGAIWKGIGVPGSPEATVGGCGEAGWPQAVTASLRPAPWLGSTTNHFQSCRQICCF